MENKNDIMRSVLKLMRAMRRRPIPQEHEFSPAVGRMLLTLKANDGVSPAELCEFMDVRPSSMSELLAKMEENGLIRRASNENDKRATKVFLSETGTEAVNRIEADFAANAAKFSECFTEEEKVQFCALCDKLSAHLEELSAAEGENKRGGHCHHGPCGPHHGPHHGPHGGPHGPRGFHGHHGPHGPHMGRKQPEAE